MSFLVRWGMSSERSISRSRWEVSTSLLRSRRRATRCTRTTRDRATRHTIRRGASVIRSTNEPRPHARGAGLLPAEPLSMRAMSFLLGGMFLVGCRGLLGINELSVDESDAGVPDASGPADAQASDAMTPGPDATSPDGACEGTGGECLRCCK